MTEERVPYKLPDEVTQLRIANRQLSERLDAALKTIGGFTDASNFQWAEYQRRIAEFEAAVQRLEQDNRRLRHLDSMPVDALRRFYLFTHYDVHAANDAGYTTQQFDSDDKKISAWLATLDGDA